MPERGAWKECKNVLCVRLDNLGDVLMTSPAIRAIRETNQDCKITLLASRAGAAIAPYISEIDEVLTFDPPWAKNKSKQSGEAVMNIVEKLKQHAFDGAVIFTVYSQNPLPAAMLCYMAGILRVAGYCRENPYHLITDWLPDAEPLYRIQHEVDRQLQLVDSLGFFTHNQHLILRTEEAAAFQVQQKLQAKGVDTGRPWLILHPGVSEVKRQYPPQYFAEVAQRLTQEQGYQVMLTGVHAERELAERIRQQAGNKAFNLCGELSLEELINLISQSPVLISNNTGPVHIAAATNTPVVVLYALTNPQHTPWKVRHKVLPFDVPAEVQSRNTIISFANERAFKQAAGRPGPEQVLDAVNTLLRPPETEELGEVAVGEEQTLIRL
ncbi:lipopolysaccharide heptosyltransferase II [Pontibacter ummariensis]|uniref:Lipopolysaccharide heptosyltransferase II n=1 Tax=Pontibacter ummariensis TaxID=1610492 RepID=A0A239FEK2_9BACT|nr:glycosyltransferase family 9 protein [Pontibacter ummariensis]PRY12285.1 lipopolysaccharide heptosyltransferase II [Pontibacter ummariensis]SNS55450.1 lipopolysaccharide heptosyltransferase II [Pontibacter ummariensis]